MKNIKVKCPIKLKHADMPDSKFNKKELAMGIKEEKEHTDNIACRKGIAKGHLATEPHYYSKLFNHETSKEGKAILKRTGTIIKDL